MFQTINYSVNRIFNSIEISVIYQIRKDSSEIREDKFFLNKEAGQSWFVCLRKNYLTQKVENYILHQKHILEGGKQYQGIETKHAALKNCLNFLRWATDERKVEDKVIETQLNKLQLVCKYCLQINADLELILPGSKNPSYLTSRDELSEILTFCKGQLEFEKQLKQAC